MVNELTQMEAESTIHEAIRLIAEHTNQLKEATHQINFTSNTEAQLSLRKTYYNLLEVTRDSMTATMSLFQTLCDSNQADFKD